MAEDNPTPEPESTPSASPTEESVAEVPLSLEERVAYLEAQNEGLKRVGLLGLILVLLLGGLLVHQTYSDLQTTSTHGLTLLNDQNQLSGALTSDELGRFQFIQAYAGGMLQSPKPVPEDFRGYVFYDSSGDPRMLIGEDKDRKTVFMVVDPQRKTAFNPFSESEPPQPGQKAPGASPTPAAK